jgi:hypothetical protein
MQAQCKAGDAEADAKADGSGPGPGEAPCSDGETKAEDDDDGEAVESDPCAICLEAFTEVEPEQALFGCPHGFHLACAEDWRAMCLSKGWPWSCPLCRTSAAVVV